MPFMGEKPWIPVKHLRASREVHGFLQFSGWLLPSRRRFSWCRRSSFGHSVASRLEGWHSPSRSNNGPDWDADRWADLRRHPGDLVERAAPRGQDSAGCGYVAGCGVRYHVSPELLRVDV